MWRTIWHKEVGVGLALYLGLVVIVDGYLNTGLFLPGLAQGSIRYSEICAAVILLNRPRAAARQSPYGLVRLIVGVYFTLLLLAALRSDPMVPALAEYRMRIVPQIVAFVIAMRGVEQGGDYRRFFLCMMALTIVIGLFLFWDLFFDRWLL